MNKNKFINIKMVFLLAIIIFFALGASLNVKNLVSGAFAFSAEEENHQQVELRESDEHGEEQAPLAYYLYWIILGIIFILILVDLLETYKKKRDEVEAEGRRARESLVIAGGLVILGISLFVFDQLPSIYGYYDRVKGLFIAGYHETQLLGYLKIVLKIMVGFILIIYTFISIPEKTEK